jgi:hypothetical protein
MWESALACMFSHVMVCRSGREVFPNVGLTRCMFALIHVKSGACDRVVMRLFCCTENRHRARHTRWLVPPRAPNNTRISAVSFCARPKNCWVRIVTERGRGHLTYGIIVSFFIQHHPTACVPVHVVFTLFWLNACHHLLCAAHVKRLASSGNKPHVHYRVRVALVSVENEKLIDMVAENKGLPSALFIVEDPQLGRSFVVVVMDWVCCFVFFVFFW